ncbi:MAG: hypothetical protein PVJ42_08785 [bacterium]|jgi:hypothetical protein
MKVALIAGLVAVLLVPSIAWCAPMGSPANNAGEENYAVTAEYETQNKKIGDEKSSSWRWLTRIAWGPTDNLDLYARIGAANLKVDAMSGGTFNGDAGAAYGLGLRYARMVNTEHNLLFFGDFQYLGFTSKGEMRVDKYDDFSGSYTEIWSNKYWWGEYQLSFMMSWHRSIWIPYAGLGLTWIDGKVDRVRHVDTGGDPYFADRGTDEFSEGVIPEFVFGMDFPLKGTARFSWELRYGGDDLSYFMGLSELWQ